MAVVGADNTLLMVVGLVAALAVLYCFILQSKLSAYNKFGYLTKIIANCMKSHKPLGFVVDRSGKMIPFVVENHPERPGLAKPPEGTNFTLVSPDMVKPSASMEIMNGPKTLFYPLPYHFPIGLQSAAALSQLGERIQKHPRLSAFMNDIKIIELLFNNTETFIPNCRQFIISSIDPSRRGGKIPYVPELPASESETLAQEDEESIQDDENEEVQEIEEKKSRWTRRGAK